MITNETEYKVSRHISNGLAARIRGDLASHQEMMEYNRRDNEEHAWRRANPLPDYRSGKSCDELGIMP